VYFQRLCKYGPKALKALVQATAACEGSWAKLIVSDLKWLHNRSEDFGDLPVPEGDTLLVWQEHILKMTARRWKVCVNKVVLAVRSGELPADDAEAALELGAFVCVQCEQCDSVFANSRALAMHQHKAHGRRADARNYADEDGICWHCGKCFHSRPRLQVHLSLGFKRNGDSSCLQQLITSNATCLNPEQLLVLEQSDRSRTKRMRARGRGVTFADVPALVPYGPNRLQAPL
jgi:hypothetical protein